MLDTNPINPIEEIHSHAEAIATRDVKDPQYHTKNNRDLEAIDILLRNLTFTQHEVPPQKSNVLDDLGQVAWASVIDHKSTVLVDHDGNAVVHPNDRPLVPEHSRRIIPERKKI